jgi:DNA polymerase-3 subunit beta
MRFRINTETFRKAIEATSHATSTGNLTPILENILIDAQYKRVVLTGNNMEMAIEYLIEKDVEVEVEGKFTLSSKFLTSYIALVQDKEITVELEKWGSVSLKTKSSQTKFKWLEPDKFPSIPTIPTLTPLIISASDIKAAIEKTLFSTANSTVRPTLAGIYMRTRDDTLCFASTDSFRLSEFRISTEAKSNQPAIIIPERAAAELSRLINEDTKLIEIFTYESQLLVVLGSIRLTSRLLSGKFPDYEAFFPSEWKSKSTILRSEFVNALKQANLVARQNNYNTKIRSKHEGSIEIYTGDTEIGASSISIAGSVEWQEDIIGVNSEYLLQVLSVIREDYVSFEYKNPLSPIVIKWVPAENGKQAYRHLIMPLKV